jgi:hypothetical protein
MALDEDGINLPSRSVLAAFHRYSSPRVTGEHALKDKPQSLDGDLSLLFNLSAPGIEQNRLAESNYTVVRVDFDPCFALFRQPLLDQIEEPRSLIGSTGQALLLLLERQDEHGQRNDEDKHQRRHQIAHRREIAAALFPL